MEAAAGQTYINVLALGPKCAFAISNEMQSLAVCCFSDFINVNLDLRVETGSTQYMEQEMTACIRMKRLGKT